MPIPAQRIKQLRAIFAKAKRSMKNRLGFTPLNKHAGHGWLSSAVAARPEIYKQMKKLRAGEPVIEKDILFHIPSQRILPKHYKVTRPPKVTHYSEFDVDRAHRRGTRAVIMWDEVHNMRKRRLAASAIRRHLKKINEGD